MSESRERATRRVLVTRSRTPARRSHILAMRNWRNTYTGYSIGSAVVWAVILLLGRRRLDPRTRNTLTLVCGGWWVGWTSATIARAGYPPPKQLTPAAEKRLRIVSSVLVALGLGNTVRLLATGNREKRTDS